jgi:cytochrome c5
MKTRSFLGLAVLAAITVVSVQCASGAAAAGRADSGAAWRTVYQVLQHPRCKNCHPIARAPLQGDDNHPHGQNVQGGPDGKGLFAMRCANCHLDHNQPGAHLPPGAPNWHLPTAAMPLVFEGRSPAQLARQLVDPTQNGGKTREQVFQHMAEDPLVLWGWNPGEGRAPVATPHAEFVAALRTWMDAGCPVPE